MLYHEFMIHYPISNRYQKLQMMQKEVIV